MATNNEKDAVQLAKSVRQIADVGIVNARADKQTLYDAADLLEALDERVAIMSEFEGDITSSAACGGSFPSRGSLLARVLAWEEIRPAGQGGGVYWVEFQSKCCPAMAVDTVEFSGMVRMVFAVVLGLENVPIARFFKKDYGKTWRCWTKQPTPEQQENTPWGLAQDDYDEHRFSGLLSEE